MKKSILIVAAITILTGVISSCGDEAKQENNTSSEQKTSEEIYQCPMKCEEEKTYSEAGSCPKCGMDLVKVEAGPKK